jgi:nucleotide-binding universal stress UspA family protein
MSHRRVIVGVDSLESSEAALDWAVTETAAVGSVLVIVHASAGAIGSSSPAWATTAARRRLDADRIQPVLRSGAAGGALVDLAFAEDTLVLGAPTHRHWSGTPSVTRYVLRHASCPVVVVPSRSSMAQRQAKVDARGPSGLACRGHVVVGVHRSEAADDLLAFGFAYAARHRLPLVAVNVSGETDGEAWFDGPTLRTPKTAEPAGAQVLAERLERFERRYPHVSVRRLIMAGEVVPGLVTASESATLLVIGAADSGIGSVVHGLVDDSTCPVAVLHRHSPHSPQADRT